jgi:hypothetical protein
MVITPRNPRTLTQTYRSILGTDQYEANESLKGKKPGHQLYGWVYSQPSLIVAISVLFFHEVKRNSFLPLPSEPLSVIDPGRQNDSFWIYKAVATTVPLSYLFRTFLFHNAFTRCYHCRSPTITRAGRTGLAYHMQSVAGRKYSADIHPACKLEAADLREGRCRS